MRLRVPALTSVGALLLTAAAAAPVVASPGAELASSSTGHHAHSTIRGIGDPYFPTYGNRGYDVRHYAINDSYDLRTGRLVGRTKLRAVATSTRSRISLDLVLTPDSVRVDGRRATFRHVQGRKLLVVPAQKLKAGERFRLVATYHGKPERIRRGSVSPWFDNGEEALAIGEPEICSWWFACNDHPRDKATYDITVRAAKGKQAISNGVLVGRVRHGATTAWHWRMSEPMAPYLAFFAVGRFQVERTTAAGLPVTYAVSKGLSPRQRATAMQLLRATPADIAWLSSLFGPYPFRAMGGVITSIYTGFALENQSRPVYPFMDRSEGATIVVHELAHQWFGDAVSVHDWRDIWLNEGFATYAEWLYRAQHGGPSVAGQLTRAYAATPAASTMWRVRIGDPGVKKLFAGAVYNRGGMTLAALANRIGPGLLTTVMRTWVTQRKYGNGDIAQFVALAERMSGQDLGGFFDAWLYTGVKPAATPANGLS